MPHAAHDDVEHASDLSPPERPDPPKAKPWIRLAILALILLSVVVAARASGVTDDLSVEKVKDLVDRSGGYGMLVYVVVFCVGELLQLPGMLFVAAGLFAFGQVNGFILAYISSVLSTLIAFGLVRSVGGSALSSIKWAFARKVLDRVEDTPIRIIIVLRLVLWIAPPLNAALALTRIRFRDYFIGTVIGLFPPILAAAFLFESLLAWVTKP